MKKKTPGKPAAPTTNNVRIIFKSGITYDLVSDLTSDILNQLRDNFHMYLKPGTNAPAYGYYAIPGRGAFVVNFPEVAAINTWAA
jgi:hypothetical protein